MPGRAFVQPIAVFLIITLFSGLCVPAFGAGDPWEVPKFAAFGTEAYWHTDNDRILRRRLKPIVNRFKLALDQAAAAFEKNPDSTQKKEIFDAFDEQAKQMRTGLEIILHGYTQTTYLEPLVQKIGTIILASTLSAALSLGVAQELDATRFVSGAMALPTSEGPFPALITGGTIGFMMGIPIVVGIVLTSSKIAQNRIKTAFLESFESHMAEQGIQLTDAMKSEVRRAAGFFGFFRPCHNLIRHLASRH